MHIVVRYLWDICTSDNLLNHFNSFMKDLNLDYNHLIQVGMDGPNVNLSFEEKF